MLRREDTTLVVVDVQEGFRKAIPDFETVARRTATLVEGARILGVPAVVTEQYPKGLGHTVDEVGLDGEPVLEKTVFAASLADGFDLDAEWQVGESGYESRSANSAWDGETLTSRVRMTVAAGGVAYRERSFAIGAVA